MAARVLLGLALLLTVLALFLPIYASGPFCQFDPFNEDPFGPARMDGMRPSLENLNDWWESISLLSSYLWYAGIASMPGRAVELLVLFTGCLLQVSSVWLTPMNSTTTRKRLLAARVLLALALLLTVLAVFLPTDPSGSFFDDPSRGKGPSLENLNDWWFLVLLMISDGKFGIEILVLVTSCLLQVSSVWLVRPYHQSRLLCWFARALSVICIGPMMAGFAIHGGRLGLGFFTWIAASFIIVIGLFLIPHPRPTGSPFLRGQDSGAGG